ncbi:MAG: DUF2793 domain-containing protein [Pseudomonadota bacterium]
MSDTAHFSLPLLAAAQAQKHVTMNEALIRLDALARLTVLRDDLALPPVDVAEGTTYIVAASPGGDWTGREGDIAFAVNGGWDFATPLPGWRAWVLSRSRYTVWTGDRWVDDLIGPTAAGAYMSADLVLGDEVLSAGASHSTALVIPDRAVVIGVTARVMSEVTGDGLISWRIGVAGSDNRYGSSIGVQAGASSNGVTGSPVAYYADTPLLITAEGGAFDGGEIRIAVHALKLTPPDFI